MTSINKVILVGRAGKDPEVKQIPSGSVANFSIATSESYKDKAGVKQETTEWTNIVAFGKLAEIIEKYVTKGSLVFVEGKLKTDKFTDKNGIEKYSTKVVINELKLLGSKGEVALQAKAAPEPVMADDEIAF